MRSEIIGKRNLNSKFFDNKDGTLTMEAHVGHIHYKDRKTGKFKECDVKFREENGEFVVDKASYKIKIPKKLNKFRFFANGKWMETEPLGIKPNVEGRIIDDPETSHKGNTVRFDNVYGEGIHLELVCRTGSVKKYIVFDQKPNKFEWKFRLAGYAKEKHIFWKPRIFDSNLEEPKTQNVKYNIKGNILTKYLPEEFFDNVVYPVRTDMADSFYAGVGDGDVDYKDESGQPEQAYWDIAHDAATGTSADYTGSGGTVRIDIRGQWDDIRIRRMFFPIDTSGLGAEATIISASFYYHIYAIQDQWNGDGYDYVALVQTDQPNAAELTTADYNNCGATDNPDKGSGDLDLSDLTNAQYNIAALNETGLGWIEKEGITMLGMREGHDIEDVFPGDPGASTNKLSGLQIRCSEQATTLEDPYLSVTIVVAGPAGVKTVNDLAVASVKTINDEPIGEVKTINDSAG